MSRIQFHSYDEKQISFFNIDQHAYKAASYDAIDFPTLIAYLKRQIPGETANYSLYLARGILAWLSHAQTISPTDEVKYKRGTPLEFVQRMVNRQIFHSEVFKLVCDAASVACEIIQGRCKAVGYKAGDSDNDYIRTKQSWNAFMADGKWHLVNPAWVLHEVMNYTRGGEYELVGHTNRAHANLPHFTGTHTNVFNDFWFCTNPEIFATRCLPNESIWQLLPSDKTIKSVEDFLKIPDLRQSFFTSKLELLTKKSCRLQTKNGRCVIAFSTDRETARRLHFSHQLTLVHGTVPDMYLADLPQCIFLSRSSETIFNFEIRILFIGIFRLNIKVGFIHEELKRTCGEFLIECDEVDEGCRKLPIDAGAVGWGPGTVSDDAGIRGCSEKTAKALVAPSPTDPSKKVKTITLRPREETLRKSIIQGSEEVDDWEGVVTFSGKRPTGDVVSGKVASSVSGRRNVPS